MYLEIGKGIESPPVKEAGAKGIWKLVYRYRRLCNRADRERGVCLNLCWYEVAGAIDQTLDQLEARGVNTEDLCFWRKWTLPGMRKDPDSVDTASVSIDSFDD